MKKIKTYRISEKTNIAKSSGQKLYEMYIVTLIYTDNTQKDIKVFKDIDSLDINSHELVEFFIINRLTGENSLIEKQGRDDYIFLGRLVKDVRGEYECQRFYVKPENILDAQQYFDNFIYPEIKKKFDVNFKAEKNENQQSSIYDEITSPFDNEENIQQLVELYADLNVKTVDSLYRKVIELDSKNENEKQRHLKEFQENIQIPNFAELYNNMRLGIDNNIQNEPRAKKIFSRFREYKELYDYAMKHNTKEIYTIYNNIELFKNNPKIKNEHINELKKLNLTPEELDFRIMVGWLENQLFNRFSGGAGVMGFHVNPQNLSSVNRKPNREKAEMKFYINAGYDTYRFARYFQEKCKKDNLNYYFKVVNPYKTREHERADKLCIYTELKDAAVFLQIIKDISKEHPDIKFRKPPLLTGNIQNFIGVGTDENSSKKISYNDRMSQICFSVFESLFKNMSKNDILNAINGNSGLLQKIKSKITEQVASFGLSTKKICIREDSISKLKNATSYEQTRKEESSLDDE